MLLNVACVPKLRHSTRCVLFSETVHTSASHAQTCCVRVADDGLGGVIAYSSEVRLAGGKATIVRMCISDASSCRDTPLQVSFLLRSCCLTCSSNY